MQNPGIYLLAQNINSSVIEEDYYFYLDINEYISGLIHNYEV